MNIRLYKLTFNNRFFEEFYDSLSDLDKQKINSIDVVSSFHYEELDNHYLFMLMLPSDLKNYKNVLNNNLIPYLCEDIGKSVINNQISLEEELLEFSDPLTYRDYDNFIYELNIWMLDNLNLDDILDRINLYGIDTLRPIDKEFLKMV